MLYILSQVGTMSSLGAYYFREYLLAVYELWNLRVTDLIHSETD